MQEEKKILLAFFDILGTSKLLNNGDYQTVYDYYSFMIKLCSDTHTPIAIVNNLYGLKNLGVDYSNAKYLIVNYDLNNCFFSDTFLLWIELDSFLQPTLAGFLEKCCIVFCEAVKRGIPLRGVISLGTAIMDKENHIFLGKPLAEAAKAEPQQNWVGIGLGESIQNILPMDMDYVLPYFKHIKTKENSLLGGWALDWPYWWRRNEKVDVLPYIEKMNNDVRFESYYKNCISFVEVSQHRDNIWNLFMLFQDIWQLAELFEMDDNISIEYKVARKQGVEALTSNKVYEFIEGVLSSNASIWANALLSEHDKEVLINLQNGLIPVNGKFEPIHKHQDY